MNPNKQYLSLAINTIEYLFIFLESYCGAYDFNIELNLDEYNIIEENSYHTIDNSTVYPIDVRTK